MNQLKKALATAGASLVLSLGAAGAAAADVTCTTTNSGVNGAQVQTCVDSSTQTSYTVSGNCSGIIQSTVNNSQSASTGQSNASTGGAGVVGGNNNSSNSNSSSTSQSQTGGVTFAPNCSVTNVSQVAAAPAAAQVKAPTGGVHAGGGAGVSASSGASIAGLVASAGSLGLGFVVRKKALLGL